MLTDFFKLLSVNPVAAIIFSLAAIILVVILVEAFRQGRPITLWPPNIGPLPQKVLIGEVRRPDTPKAHEMFGDYKGIRGVLAHVDFVPPFKKTPEITVSLKEIDIDVGTNCRLRVGFNKPNRNGFDILFETWEDSKVWNAVASWIAVGE